MLFLLRVNRYFARLRERLSQMVTFPLDGGKIM